MPPELTFAPSLRRSPAFDPPPDEALLDQRLTTWKEQLPELREWNERWVDAWQVQDVDGVVALVADDIAYKDPSMLGKVIHGRDEFRAFVEMYFHAFPGARFEQLRDWPVYLALDGCGVAVPWRCVGAFTGDMRHGPSPLKLAPTNKTVDVEGVDLYKLRDGLLYDWISVVNTLDMVEQIGVAPIHRVLPFVNAAQRVVAPLIRRFG